LKQWEKGEGRGERKKRAQKLRPRGTVNGSAIIGVQLIIPTVGGQKDQCTALNVCKALAIGNGLGYDTGRLNFGSIII